MDTRAKSVQYGAQEPDWDRLTAMINELAAKKGLVRLRTPSIVEAEEGHAPQRLKDVSYRRLGQALKKSPTIIYGIVDRYYKPSVETLAAIADFASQAQSSLQSQAFSPQRACQ